MTKKEKILRIFNNAEWIESPSGGLVKIIEGKRFYDVGLAGSWEFGEKYNDIAYAAGIIRKMGHRVLVGSAFNIYKDKLKK